MALWLAGGWSLLSWAVQEARRAVPTLAQLPPTCREALAHAALTCKKQAARQPTTPQAGVPGACRGGALALG